MLAFSPLNLAAASATVMPLRMGIDWKPVTPALNPARVIGAVVAEFVAAALVPAVALVSDPAAGVEATGPTTLTGALGTVPAGGVMVSTDGAATIGPDSCT